VKEISLTDTKAIALNDQNENQKTNNSDNEVNSLNATKNEKKRNLI